MPQLRKLAPLEIRTLEYTGSSRRRQVHEEYDAFLQDFAPGDYGVAELAPEDKRMTVAARLRAAAIRRGFTLTLLRTRGPSLRFRIEADDVGGGVR